MSEPDSAYVDTGGDIPEPSGVDVLGIGADELRDRLGERFGGVWSNAATDVGPTIHVAVVGERSGDRTMVEQIVRARTAAYRSEGGHVGDVTIDIQAVEHSEATLIALESEVNDAIAALAGSKRRWSNLVVEIDPRQNAVIASVDKPDPILERHLSERFASQPLIYSEDTSRTFRFRNSSRTDYPPYIAGLSLFQSGDYVCTSGFVFKTGTSRPYYGSTAGHCEDHGQNELWYIGGDYVGKTSINVEDASTNSVIDALLFQIAPEVTSSKVYVSANSDRYVRRRTERSEMNLGASICVSPRSRPGGYCGPVYRTNITVYIAEAGKYYREVYCVGIGGILEDGDSGAPFYKQLPSTSGINNAAAAGLFSFSEYMINGSVEECFVSVIGIEAATGKRVGVIP